MVLMFPGQGSQAPGMGGRFLKFNDKYLEYFEKASITAGADILKVIKGEDPLHPLNDTRFSQVAIFTLSCVMGDYLLRDLLLDRGSIYSLMGHSLGEYSALCCCGAYSFEDGLKLVSYRGNVMSSEYSGIKGMMAAVIGAPVELIMEVLENYRGRVFISNYNDYTQVVLGGYRKDVEKAMDDLKKRGVKKVIALKVNTASHCPVMKDISLKLRRFIEENMEFSCMELPFFSTTEVAFRSVTGLEDTLEGQLVNPIRWVESVEYFLKQGSDTFIEIGPGKVLSGLTGRIARKNEIPVNIFNTCDLEDIEVMIENLQEKGLLNEA